MADHRIGYLAAFLLCCCACFFVGKAKGRRNAPVLPAKTDTLVVVRRDTIRLEKPAPSGTAGTQLVFVPVRDTVTVRDTLWMAVQMEAKEYRGDDYRAVVSGWRPSLDLIEVYPKTTTVTTTIDRPVEVFRRRGWRLGFGVTAGAGAYWNGSAVQPGLGVTAGLTLSY